MVGTNSSTETSPQAPLRIYMLELWSFIPYYLAALSSALRRQGVSVTIGSARYHLARRFFRDAGLPLDRWLLDFGGGFRNRGARRMLKTAEYLLNLCALLIRFALHPPHILHVQYVPFLEAGLPVEIYFLRLVRCLGIPIVYTVHNVTHQDRGMKHANLHARAYRIPDMLICHSDSASHRLQTEFGVPPTKIQIIPHGPLFQPAVRAASSPSLRERLGLPLDIPIALCAGVISPYKGIPFLIDAWKQIQHSHATGLLVIAGTGDPALLDQIRTQVERLSLRDSVDLRLEYIPSEVLPLLSEAADVLVYPYQAGSTSGALLSGLQHERALLTTRLPLFTECLLEGRDALMVDFGDVPSLARELGRLLTDRALRERLAQAAGHRKQEQLDWEAIAQKTSLCYTQVLEQAARVVTHWPANSQI